MAGNTIFVPGIGSDGTELWQVTVDPATGTAGTPTEVADIFSGTYANGTPHSGFQVFEPTSGGTPVLTEIQPDFTQVGSNTYFVAAGMTNGSAPTGPELWVVDGGGTVSLVSDINPSVATGQSVTPAGGPSEQVTLGYGSDIANLMAVGSTALVFTADTDFGLASDSSATSGLWSTAGGGATQITAFGLYAPSDLVAFDGAVAAQGMVRPATALTAYTGLVVTDGNNFGVSGSSLGTVLVSSSDAPTFGLRVNAAASPLVTTGSGGAEMFIAAQSTSGTTDASDHLWLLDAAAVSTATTTGSAYAVATDLTASLNINEGSRGIRELTEFGTGHALFVVADNELWSSDGTTVGTGQLGSSFSGKFIDQIQTFSTGSGEQALFLTENTIDPGLNPLEQVALEKVDGTTVTQVATDAAALNQFVRVGSNTFFETSDGAGDRGLGVIADSATSAVDLTLSSGFTLDANTMVAGPGGEVYFTTSNGSETRLEASDGTSVSDITTASVALTSIDKILVAGSNVFFVANDAAGGSQLWVTAQGSSTATELTNFSGNGDHSIGNLLAIGNSVAFTANDAPETFLSTGSGAPTVLSTTPLLFNNEAACFLAGTRIATPAGQVPVEAIKVGDFVMTADGRAERVIWTGNRRVDVARHPTPAKVRPVRVRAGALGPNLPTRDLLLSPDHALLIEDSLVPVRCLIDGHAVVQENVAQAHYWHLELALHDAVLAEGVAAETYLDTGNRSAFADQGLVTTLHPDFTALSWERACAPLRLSGKVVSAARARIAARARSAA